MIILQHKFTIASDKFVIYHIVFSTCRNLYISFRNYKKLERLFAETAQNSETVLTIPVDCISHVRALLTTTAAWMVDDAGTSCTAVGR